MTSNALKFSSWMVLAAASCVVPCGCSSGEKCNGRPDNTVGSGGVSDATSMGGHGGDAGDGNAGDGDTGGHLSVGRAGASGAAVAGGAAGDAAGDAAGSSAGGTPSVGRGGASGATAVGGAAGDAAGDSAGGKPSLGRGGTAGAAATEGDIGGSKSYGGAPGGSTGTSGEYAVGGSSVDSSGGLSGVAVGGDSAGGQGSGGLFVGSAGAPGPTLREPLAEVENGAPCSPIAARACSAQDPRAQMVCSAGNVWQWDSDCVEGEVCDSRTGLRVGTCTAPSDACLSLGTDGCYSGRMVRCTGTGIQLEETRCVTGTCASVTECDSSDVCSSDLDLEDSDIICTDECPQLTVHSTCGVPGVGAMAGYDHPTWHIVLPSASRMPVVAECPSMHVFLLYDSKNSDYERRITLPPGYWGIVVDDEDPETRWAEIVVAACQIPTIYDNPILWDPGKGEGLLIVTNQLDAPAFLATF